MGLDVVYVSGSKIPLNNYHILEYDRDICNGPIKLRPCKPDCVKSSLKIRHNPLIYPHVRSLQKPNRKHYSFFLKQQPVKT